MWNDIDCCTCFSTGWTKLRKLNESLGWHNTIGWNGLRLSHWTLTECFCSQTVMSLGNPARVSDQTYRCHYWRLCLRLPVLQLELKCRCMGWADNAGCFCCNRLECDRYKHILLWLQEHVSDWRVNGRMRLNNWFRVPYALPLTGLVGVVGYRVFNSILNLTKCFISCPYYHESVVGFSTCQSFLPMLHVALHASVCCTTSKIVCSRPTSASLWITLLKILTFGWFLFLGPSKQPLVVVWWRVHLSLMCSCKCQVGLPKVWNHRLKAQPHGMFFTNCSGISTWQTGERAANTWTWIADVGRASSCIARSSWPGRCCRNKIKVFTLYRKCCLYQNKFTFHFCLCIFVCLY